MQEQRPIIIVGAGLTGCAISLFLSQRFPNDKIVVLEGRPDARLSRQQEVTTDGKFGQLGSSTARSINLALSYRGICTLKALGLYEEIVERDMLILMKGRYMHGSNGETYEQLYGQDHQGIYSVSRTDLNFLLMDTMEKQDNIEIIFERKCRRVFQEGVVQVQNTTTNEMITFNAKFVLGCDGVFSNVRESVRRLGRYNFRMDFIPHGYKELTIFPQNDEFTMPPNYLHIWPRHEFMLIGLPNPDKTFTCTLFAPFDGEGGLDTLTDQVTIRNYFLKYFPDFVDLCPDFVEQCLKNPSSPLGHVHFYPWHYRDEVLLLGDAAHAIVPFYGQGMNCAFEDTLLLDELFDKHENKIGEVFEEFSEIRFPSAEALSDLSLHNYVEMRSHTAKTWFLVKKRLEKTLNWIAPNIWRPLYSMVAFSRTPYHEAITRADKQDKWLGVGLASMCIGVGIIGAGLGLTWHRRQNQSRGNEA